LHTHLGVFSHDDMIGCELGEAIRSQLNHPGLLLEPSLYDLMTHLKRGTQIVYPKDAAWLVFRLNLHSGSRIIEAGTGSASLTTALAWTVAPEGRVFTYEARPEAHDLARRNLERVGLLPFVTMHLQQIEDGFVESWVDAVFLDVREPWIHLDTAAAALRRGGFFASLLPTTNQVSALLTGLEANGFVDVMVEEILLRGYKPVSERLRPEDSMIAHTGYLISARCLSHMEDTSRWQTKERQRHRGRMQTRQRLAQMEEERARGEDTDAEGGRKYPRLPLPG
jgi:tRNA (adenine57-N1/adenine58-N1)-methyltransferase catalytic subunit